MTCPHCSETLPEGSKFCNHCGTPLTSSSDSAIPVPNHAALLQKYIPHELANKILSAGAQIESERRVVTVLFADVTGFTMISEKLDPELVTTILNECFRGLIDIVYRYEGFIDKFIGDEIMAIFGAPISHENDPERAIRCSLEMLAYINRFNVLSSISLPQPLGIHIGINTGTVIAGNVGSDLRMNYSVIGDTVNLAARLVGAAHSGQIVTSNSTYQAVHSIVKTGEPEIMQLKGKSEPVKVYPIVGVKDTMLPGEREIRDSAFVGRSAELALCNTAITSLESHKEFRIFVRGEAGVGKSRLKLEFKNIANQHGIIMVEGKCSSFEINTPYYLWNTFLKSLLGIDREASESETKNRLHDFLQILDMQHFEPYLATLLSLRYEQILLEEDDSRKAKIFESVVEVLKKIGIRKKMLLVFEDLHWIDKFSDRLLQHIFQQTTITPSIFVLLFRGEYMQATTLLRHGGTLVDLNRLSLDEALTLSLSRLSVKEIPPQLMDLIFKRSEGNPFFIEEIIRTMRERKAIEVDHGEVRIIEQNIAKVIPDTVQGIIMSRIDRLEERIKEVLYPASVIGREFSRPVLEKVTNKAKDLSASLARLNSLELILPKEEAKELEYLFKHYLIQEVAYNTLLLKKRKELHGKIALAIETLYADQLREYYELLAFHYEKAEQWEKAASFLSMSGRKAEEIFTKEESQEFSERKEIALERLFASEAEKATLLFKILNVVAILLSAAISLLFIAEAIQHMFTLLGVHIDVLDFFKHNPRRVRTVFDDILILLFGIAWSFLPWKLLKANSEIGRLRLYEVLDEKISMVFKDGERIDIPFSELQSISYESRTTTFSEKIKREFTILGLSHRPIFGAYRLNWKILPMMLGSGKSGYIFLRRRKGISGILAQITIGSNKRKILQTVKNLGITPAQSREFYDQLVLSFTKWKNKHCIHCSSFVRESDHCPSCGYSAVRRDETLSSSQHENIRLRPVKNILLDILECIVNPGSIGIAFWITPLFLWTEGLLSTFMWFPFIVFPLIALLPMTYLTLYWYCKKKTENNLTIVVTDSIISYTGDIPYLKGFSILLQDILCVRRYANPWQRMFGLGNIELEIRNGLPFTNEGPLYHIVIPSIRESGNVEKLLREKCKFLTT